MRGVRRRFNLTRRQIGQKSLYRRFSTQLTIERLA
jgi:hypothetical protein